MLVYQRIFPYSSDYLRDLMYRKRMSADEIHAQISEIQDWLSEYVNADGCNNYQWSKVKTMVYSGNKEEFSDLLYFRYKTDLLLFKLRWSIG